MNISDIKTFGDLITAVREDLFVDGLAENVLNANGKSFVQALSDLQTAVPCLRYSNTNVYPQCSTYFNCGLTVLPKPSGDVLRVYTIGRPGYLSSQQNQVATLTVEFGIVQIVNGKIVEVPVTGTLGTVPSDGVYSIDVDQTNSLSSLYAANSPQYVKTQITYTDTSGVQHVVQPADLLHVNVSGNSGTLNIDCQAGSVVTYSITAFNSPQVDGTINVTMTLTSGASGVSAEDWCQKVYYQQVEYKHIESYVKACRNCSAASNSIWQVANAIVAQMFGSWRQKRFYNPPTDIGYESLPTLPPGFHYPQTSTDAGGRSRSGVYAIKHGRIYIAPWIESTESLVIEWNGLKNNWSSSDLVSNDPTFYQAVKLKVAMDHYSNYEDNASRLAGFKSQFFGSQGAPGVLRELIVACREHFRQRDEWEIGSTEGDAAEGNLITSGTTSDSSVYYNTVQSYTANCPSGQTGSPVTATIAAGTYSSSLSQADANAQALSAAQSQANSQLSCTAGGTFLNTAQTYTAQCPSASGTTPAAKGTQVTVTIAAGKYSSVVSQTLADTAAMAAAQAAAEAQLTCTYYNAPQTATVTCGDSTQQTATVSAGQYSSTDSQSDADSQALAAAQSQATGMCPSGSGFTVGNTPQTISYSLIVTSPCKRVPYSGTIIIPANTFVAQATLANKDIVIAALNLQAQAYANQKLDTLKSQWQIQVNNCPTES